MKSSNVSKQAHLHVDMSYCPAAILDTDPEVLFFAPHEGMSQNAPLGVLIGNA